MATIAFIGLGVMGYPMAGHLARAGYDVSVWNRTSEKARQWAEQYPGKACDSIADAVANADVVLTCVGADKDLEEVYTARMASSATPRPQPPWSTTPLHLPALPRHWHRRPVHGARALSTPRFPAASKVPRTAS